MTRILSIIAALFWCLGTIAANAQSSTEKILPMDGHITGDGRGIELNWFDAKPPRVGSVTVKRRLYGQTGGHTWQVIADALGPVMRYRDDTIRPGVAYEYQVLRTARDIVDVGYWLAGTDIPAQANRGNAYVIVDETVAEAIAPRLERFKWDLIGDGWQVVTHEAPRGDARQPVENLKAAAAIREWLRARYNADPFGQHTVILVGHVPIVMSGRVAPDGHGARAHPTDLFYADMDGRWSATRSGEVLDSQVPGDFIEMQVGRIDFEPASKGVIDEEIRLIRAYFDKNHHWRMGYHGDLREVYGTSGHLAIEQAGLRNIVGSKSITEGGHHDVGEEKPWLWGVDFGDWNGSRYAQEHANKAIFALNFGSHKQMINGRDNGMTALLAQEWYPVAVGWGARPAWWLHHMALGGSIGDVHMRTVNNGRAADPYRESMDYFPPGGYLMRNGIWVNLLGDPTLRAFPLAAPQNAVVSFTPKGTKLSWQPSPDPDTQGYRIFRAGPDEDAFALLSGAELVMSTEYLDSKPPEDARYMVRAYGLKDVYAGSFYALSQGSFAADIPLSETEITLPVAAGQNIPLPDVFNTPSSDAIYAIIEGPIHGELTYDGTQWAYSTPDDLKKTVFLRFSISRTGQTSEQSLKLHAVK